MPDLIVDAFDPFLELVKTRNQRIASRQWEYVWSEETYRFDYALTLGTPGARSQVFAEFPYDKDRNQKADLFLDEEPGYFLEVKYFRAIPSGQSTPLTQHFGSLVADFLKLTLLANQSRIRYGLIVAEGAFQTYLRNSQMAQLLVPGSNVLLDPSQLPMTAQNEVEKRLPRIGDARGAQISITSVRVSSVGSKGIMLVRVGK